MSEYSPHLLAFFPSFCAHLSSPFFSPCSPFLLSAFPLLSLPPSPSPFPSLYFSFYSQFLLKVIILYGALTILNHAPECHQWPISNDPIKTQNTDYQHYLTLLALRQKKSMKSLLASNYFPILYICISVFKEVCIIARFFFACCVVSFTEFMLWLYQ